MALAISDVNIACEVGVLHATPNDLLSMGALWLQKEEKHWPGTWETKQRSAPNEKNVTHVLLPWGK